MIRQHYSKIIPAIGLFATGSTISCIEDTNDVHAHYVKATESCQTVEQSKFTSFPLKSYVWMDYKKCKHINTFQIKKKCEESLQDHMEYIREQIKTETLENLSKINFDTVITKKMCFSQIDDFLVVRIMSELEKKQLLKSDFLKIMELAKKINNKSKMNIVLTDFIESKLNLPIDEFFWYYDNLSYQPITNAMGELLITVINKELEKGELSKTDFLKLMDLTKKVKTAIPKMEYHILCFMQKKQNLKIDEFYWYYNNLRYKSKLVSDIMSNLLETHIISENKGKLLDKTKYAKYSIPNYDALIVKIIKNNPDIQTYESIADKLNAEIKNKKIGYFRSFVCDTPNKFKEFKYFMDYSSSGISAELQTEYKRCNIFNNYYLTQRRVFRSLKTFFHTLSKDKAIENLVYDKTNEKFTELIMGIGAVCYLNTNPGKEQALIEFIVNNKIGFRLEYIDKLNSDKTFIFLLNKIKGNEIFVQNYISDKMETHKDFSTHNFVKSNEICLIKLLRHFIKKQPYNIIKLYSLCGSQMNNIDVKSKMEIFDEIKGNLTAETMGKYIIELHKNDKTMYKYVASDTFTINKLDLSSLIESLNKFI